MKTKLILVGSLALMLATAGSAMAAPNHGAGTGACNGLTEQQRIERQASHDSNGDGICDNENCTQDGTAHQYGNGDGTCDGTQPQNGTGMHHGGRTR